MSLASMQASREECGRRLTAAIANGDVVEVERILALPQGQQERAELASGLWDQQASYIPLDAAISRHSLPLVRALLAAGASMDVVVSEELPLVPLCIVRAAPVEILEALLQAEPLQDQYMLDSCLHIASRRGMLEHSRVMLARGAQVNAQRYDGASALLLAVICNNIDLVRMLIEQGADVNHDHPKVLSPLQSAALEANLEIVNLLLDAGANPHHRSLSTRTDGNYTCLIRVCDSMGSRYSHPKRLEVARRFLDLGVDPNAQGADGCTALLLAASHGFLDLVRELLDRGADVTLATSEMGVAGVTALQMASQNGHVEIVRMLLLSGSDVNARDARGTTPLIAACRNMWNGAKYKELITDLLDAGALVHCVNMTSESALAYVRDNLEAGDALRQRMEQLHQSDTLSDD